MKEYAFASALLLVNICIYFLNFFILYSVAYELALFKVHRNCMNVRIRMENRKTDKNHLFL